MISVPNVRLDGETGRLDEREGEKRVVRFETGWVGLLRWHVEFFFGLYRKSLATQDDLTTQALEDFKRELDEEAQKYDEHVRDEFYEYRSEEYTSQEYSIVILMNSFFVTSYALYEHHRNEIRDRFCVTKSDFEDSSLMNSSEWRAIRHYKVIRDQIMHEGATIPECDEIVAFAECKGIAARYFPTGTYALTRRFCDEALDTFEKFLLMGVEEFSNDT